MQTYTIFEEVERRNEKLQDSTGIIESVFLDKVRLTENFIEECLNASVNPVCLCSFGKDSLVMLHLIMKIKKIPIIFWREPFFQSKFEYPQNIMKEWDLEVYSYPPSYVDYLQLEDYFDVYNFYYVNGKHWINLYTGIRNYKSEDKKFLCAFKDLLQRPKINTYEFKWDCIFHGHKQCDPMFITDRIELPKLIQFGKGILSLPIKDWINEEIWEYINNYKLPYNKERYDNHKEESNTDLIPACFNCLDYRNINKKVFCPKINKEIPCIAKSREDNLEFKKYLLNITYKKGV